MTHKLAFITGLFLLSANLSAAEPAKRVERVLFVGNSITNHGPREKLDWTGDWGMAASAREKDYVHLFLAKLAAEQGGAAPDYHIAGGGGGKVTDQLKGAAKYTEYKADLGIVQLGENDKENVTKEGFQADYEAIITAIQAGNPQARIICVGVWSPPKGNPFKDRLIQAACAKTGATFASLAAANPVPANKAESENRYTNKGVQWHPSDAGMQAYADAIWAAYTGAPADSPATPAQLPTSVALREDWSGKSGLTWEPRPFTVNQVAFIKPGVAEHQATIPIDAFKGKHLEITTTVSGKQLSVAPRMLLRLVNAEGEDSEIAAKLPEGTFSSQPAQIILEVPDNIVTAHLVLGLGSGEGTLEVGVIEIGAGKSR